MPCFTLFPSPKSTIRFNNGEITIQIVKLDDVFQERLKIDEFIHIVNRTIFHLHDRGSKSFTYVEHPNPEDMNADHEAKIVEYNKFPTLETISNTFGDISRMEIRTPRGLMFYTSDDLTIEICIKLHKQEFNELVEIYQDA